MSGTDWVGVGLLLEDPHTAAAHDLELDLAVAVVRTLHAREGGQRTLREALLRNHRAHLPSEAAAEVVALDERIEPVDAGLGLVGRRADNTAVLEALGDGGVGRGLVRQVR